VASNSVHEGPLPVLVRDIAAEEQAEWIARFVRQMARHLHLKASAAAVLVPVATAGETLATELQAQGVLMLGSSLAAISTSRPTSCAC
jgi:hypothetical protein